MYHRIYLLAYELWAMRNLFVPLSFCNFNKKIEDRFEGGNLCLVAGWGATEEEEVSRFVSHIL